MTYEQIYLQKKEAQARFERNSLSASSSGGNLHDQHIPPTENQQAESLAADLRSINLHPGCVMQIPGPDVCTARLVPGPDVCAEVRSAELVRTVEVKRMYPARGDADKINKMADDAKAVIRAIKVR